MPAALLWGVLISLIVLGCEIVLKVATAISPRAAYLLTPPEKRWRIADSRLGFRLSPFYPGNDWRGYRNPGIPDSVDVLAIGDSFTYGYGAEPEYSWPRQLEKLTGRTVYNAGVPGYGPCEYRLVLDELLRLRPRFVMLAILTGNDLSNAYVSAYEEKRCSEFRTKNPSLLAQLSRLDQDSTLMELAVARGWETTAPPQAPLGLVRLRVWLSNNSALYGLVRELRFLLETTKMQHHDRFAEDAARPGRVVFAGPSPPRTVFKNPEVFMLAVNLADPRIREGLRITQSILLDIQAALRARRIGFGVMIVMDKPAVYAPVLAEKQTTVPPAFFKLGALEENMADSLSGFMREHSIPSINVASALRASLRSGVAVYPEWDDHHNNAAGYGVIAAVAAAQLPAMAVPGGATPISH
jgi:hypothetical protein